MSYLMPYAVSGLVAGFFGGLILVKTWHPASSNFERSSGISIAGTLA